MGTTPPQDRRAVETCPVCGAPTERAEAQYPVGAEQIGRQIEFLQQRLAELERGQRSPSVFEEQMDQACPSCRELMGGANDVPEETDLPRQIMIQLDQLRRQFAELEHRRQ